MSSESSQHLQDLGHDLHILRTPKPAPWNASKIIIEGPRKRTQNISWPGPKRNSAKISTASQRERSATHKVTRRLREPCQNSQRTTTRAIRHTQCTETVARAMSKFAARYNESDPTRTKCREGCARAISNCHRATNRAIRHTHTQSDQKVAGFSHFFAEVYKVLRLPRKIEPEANRGLHFVRAWAVEMHMDISQGHFYAGIYTKHSAPQRAYPDLTLAL